MKHTLKSTLIYIAAMIAALILCLDDIEGWPMDFYCDEMDDGPCECVTQEILTVESWSKGDDWSVLRVWINRDVIEDPTDSMMELFSDCAIRLLYFEKRAGVKYPAIIFTNNGWLPSPRVLTLEMAEKLWRNEPDMEELAYMHGYIWDAGERD
jgi:hypothetical protein